MTFGSGLFASTALILIALSVWQITKRKKWKLFGKVFAWVMAACALVAGLIYFSNYVSNRPKPVTEFEGVNLGSSITDVTVILGAPSKIKDNRISFDDKDIFADFSDDKLRSLKKLCSFGENLYLMGFSKTSTERDITKLLGKPSDIRISGDGLSKIINYRKWNAAFGIKSNHVEIACMTSDDLYFADEMSPADLSKLDLKKLMPPAAVAAEPVTSDIDGDLADPCASDLSKAERKRRLSKFGTIRETGLGTYEAGGHRLVLSDSTLIACE